MKDVVISLGVYNVDFVSINNICLEMIMTNVALAVVSVVLKGLMRKLFTAVQTAVTRTPFILPTIGILMSGTILYKLNTRQGSRKRIDTEVQILND